MSHYKPDTLYHSFLQVIRFHYYRSHMLLEKIGVYPGQPPMLFALQKKDGQSQTELAHKLNVRPATITVMLNRMEKEDLVERRQDPDDHRISRVYLSDKGKKVCQKVNEVIKVIEVECFKNFSKEEKVLLRRLLMQMRDNLKEACKED